MKEAISPQEMKTIEDNASAMGVSPVLLMENAGRSVAELIMHRFPDVNKLSIWILCGTGNNGGDGFVSGRHLAGHGANVNIILLGKESNIKTMEATSSWRQVTAMTKTISTHFLYLEKQIEDLRRKVGDADIIVDALLGTGVQGNLRPLATLAIELINSSSGYKISVDIPSGLDPLTGVVHDIAVKADVTITFHRMKVGLVGGKKLTGEVVIAPIGIPKEAEIKMGLS